MELTYAASTCPGAVRKNNEDSYAADANLGLFVVADGMGGHSAGEVASAIATYQIQRASRQGTPLREAIRLAHEAVLENAHELGNHMGSTVVAFKTTKQDSFDIAWVGDSRAYLWDFGTGNNNLSRLSRDHSFVQTLIEEGSISEAEARVHPHRHIITQCLGHQGNPAINIDHSHHKWEANQWVVLCTDGLNGEVSDQAIADTLAASASPESAVAELEQLAMDAGGSDNITVLIVSSPQSPTLFEKTKSWWRNLFNRTHPRARD